MNRGLFIIVINMVLAVWASGVCRANVTPEILVGSELEFPPYATVDSQGQPTGFSVDLIRAVAGTMGLRVKFSTGLWEDVWNDLVDGRIDALPIVAKLPERTRLVDFSLPHTETFDAFFVRKGQPVFKDLASAREKEIVVMRSDYAHHALLEKKFDGKLILVDSIPEGLRLISSGRHDAFLCSKLIGTLAIKEHVINGLAAGPSIPDYKRTFSFAVRKGDAELLEKLNQGLHLVKLNGEYERLYQKWLDTDEPWRKFAKYFFPAVLILFTLLLFAVGMLVILKRLVDKRTRELTESNEALRRAGEDLEERVRLRTAEVIRSNEALEREISERKQIEEQLRALNEELERKVEKRTRELQESQIQVLHAEKLSAIGRLSASIAHEFNNPLQTVMTIIKGFKNTLVGLEEQDRVFLDLAFDETERMKNLIRNLQDFNRPSSGRKVFMDIHATMDSLLLLSKSDLKRKGISTVIQYAERLPQIFAIPDQIKQVLINLLQNAADACHGDKGVITISTYHEDNKVAVAIKDNGIGIAPDNLTQIFQPFYTTKSEVKGTGLGLSICHGIVVKNHQGEIRVESEPGKGSLFTVLLPIVGENAQN